MTNHTTTNSIRSLSRVTRAKASVSCQAVRCDRGVDIFDWLPLRPRSLGKAIAIHILILLNIANAHAASPPSFPGAEGFGAAATGGRGGRVIYVTNLNTSGAGSLQWALDQPGRRYVLFKVSGLIDGVVHLKQGNVTIAGETSPAGVTVRGFITDEQPYQDQLVQRPAKFAENWILRNIRIRPGEDGEEGDGLRLRYTKNAMIDGVSIGNARDEAVEISYSSGISVQRSILAETIGDHAFYGGMLINYSNPVNSFPLDRITIHHNAFIRIMGRLPEASRESPGAGYSRMRLELANNLYWDPDFFVALGSDTGVVTDSSGIPFPAYTDLNFIGNRMVVRPSYPYGLIDDSIARRTPAAALNRLFVSDNTIDRYPTLSDWSLFYCCNDFQEFGPDTSTTSAKRLTSRHVFPSVAYHFSGDLPNWMLANAGAWPRDPMDKRLLSALRNKKIELIDRDINPADDTLRPAYYGSAPPPPLDTDGDGMPDSWERSKGLNSMQSNANSISLSKSGYTNLEFYLHERVRAIRTQ